MSESYTASFHNGGLEINGVDTRGRKRRKLYQACREHNIRDPTYCDKQDHIVKGGHHETWIDIPPKEAYEQIFGEAFREFNGKQKKKSRQFDSYWEKVRKSKDLVPVREALITIGNCNVMPDEKVQKEIYKAYIEEFKKANPNMVVIGAYYHADEMRDDGNGGLIKGAPHVHLDYIPVAYKCERGQKIQNTMNGALLEQGILNIEIDPEVAVKKFGLREKVSKKKKKPEKHSEPEIKPLNERMKCLPKLDEAEASQEETKKGPKPRVVTNLVQWTTQQRNLLVKVAREHGLTIENPNEKREHLSTEDYIYSKDQNLKGQVYALAEKLLEDVKEVDSEKELIIDWETEITNREESADQKDKNLQKKVDEYNQNLKKAKEYYDYRESKAKLKEKEAQEKMDDLEEKKSFFESAKLHVSTSLHKFVSKLKKKKKELEVKDKNLDQMLNEASEIAKKAKNLSESTAEPYYHFADDIQFDEARLMASRGDGNGLCNWFNKLGHKFGGWLHKAQYFAKTFWNKTPDELVGVAEDMRHSYCTNLGEYLEKGMKGNTLSQIQETREIQEKIPEIKSKKRRLDYNWDR